MTSTKPTVLILTAMPEELQAIENVLKDYDHVVAKLTGVGKVQSASKATELILKYSPKYVLMTGVAGALSDHFGLGDVIISSGYFQHDFGFYADETGVQTNALGTMPQVGYGEHQPLVQDLTSQNLYKKVNTLIKSGALHPSESIQTENGTIQPKVQTGVYATGDQFIAGVIRKEKIKSLGADVAEMEAASICHVARKFGTECLIIKAMSDSANGEAVKSFPQFLHASQLNNAEILKKILDVL